MYLAFSPEQQKIQATYEVYRGKTPPELFFFLDKSFVLLWTAVSLPHVALSAPPTVSSSAVRSFASITARLPQAHSGWLLTGLQTDASVESVATKSQLTSHISPCAA